MKYSSVSRTYRSSKRRLAIVLAVVFALLAGVAVVGIRVWYLGQLQPLTTESHRVTITVEPGSTAADIAKQLQSAKIIKSAWAFERYVASNGMREMLQAGTYELDSSLSIPKIADAISNGKVQRGLFTIVPGLRLDQIRTAMINAGFDEASIDAALDPKKYKNHPALVGKPEAASLEGYLFPESYERVTTTTPEDIVRQALDETAKALAPDRIEQFTSRGLTSFKAITLASIVLKESSSADRQKMIAGVLYNRLRDNIPLGADVTYQYAADMLGVERDAALDSPYNTRIYTGLPPGPVSNVTASSLEAVARPTETDYMFFVAGDDGKIYFSKTIAEHEKLSREHCKVICSVY